MKILLTGSNGFIGSHLLKLLVADKSNQVLALSRTPLDFNAPNCKNIVADLASSEFTKELTDPVDVVIHLAQSKKHRKFPDGADDMFRINVAATFNQLEWSRKNGVKKFIFTSSGSVYKTGNEKLTENSPLVDHGFYPLSKLLAEKLINEYSSFFETIILRLFSPYGPGQTGMLISNTIEKVKNNEAITLSQGKGIILAPIYIDDCCKMVERVMHEKMDNGIYNLAGDTTVSLKEIVTIIAKELNVNVNILPQGGVPPFLVADSEKLYKAIKMKPTISMADGLHITVASMNAN